MMIMKSHFSGNSWMYFGAKWILIFNFLITGFVVGESEICMSPETMSPDTMRGHLHMTAVPRGKFNAGFIEVDREVDEPAQCILSCCENVLCNIAWFTQGQCYTIECDQKNEGACGPVKQSEPKFNDTLFIQVRSLNETGKVNECNLLKKDCDENQMCELNDNLVTRCVCLPGFKHNLTYSKKCVKDTVVPSKEATVDTKTTSVIQGCEFGITRCGEHKHCYIPKESKSMNGLCQCDEGYSRDSTGKCVKMKDQNTLDTDEPDTGHTGVSTPIDFTVISTVTSKALQKQTTTTTPKPVIKVETTPKVEQLTVSVGDNKEIQLPENQVTLKAFTLPEETKADPYHYEWTLEAHPDGVEMGTMEGKYTNTLTLKKLIEGLYTFRVQVTGTNKFGEARVNVTVNPPARQNTPPVAVITPANLEMKQQNSAILDASGSTDDDKIVSYLWEMVKGPILETAITGDASILNLKDLVPGSYTFKLTVTDSDGASNSTTANVTVIKETDYPPKANAGSDVVIHLPQNSVILYGNQSTDDKGIVSYEWIKASQDNVAEDMQGARTSELHLSHLEVGDYTYTLKVTDAAGQVSTADVHVYVKPEENTPPVAKTAGTLETSLPLDNILLDGSNSTDDQKVTSYLWQQTGGATILSIQDADKATATASGEIKVGKYEFKLMVKDKEGLSNMAVLVVNVKQVENEPPVAHAGGDKEVQLPQGLVTLDGSHSTDDHKITEYHWIRDINSLAAGEILNDSDSQAVLQLVNLVAGRYVFTLTVVDGEGLSSSDKASILVKEANHKTDLMELELEADISQFTEENKKNLQGQLALLLPRQPDEGETTIEIESITEDISTGNLRILFYAINKLREKKTYRNGVKTLDVLKEKLLSSPYVLEFKVADIDTLICQKNCSDHGHCDLKTKKCICEAFWTQNLFLYYIHGESNCDWSILYVVIVSFLIVISLTGAIWGCIFCWQRRRCRCRCNRCRIRSKKRHRYALLADNDEEERIELKSGKTQNSSLMVSESEFSSEEETIFVNHKKTNGHIGQMNGFSKQNIKTKLKT